MHKLEFFHDLQCLSGFGDRILDLWAASTIAELHTPGSQIGVFWEDGLSYLGFVGVYSTKLFSVANCLFVNEPPDDAVRMPKEFSHTELNDIGIVELASGVRQMVLRSGRIWGNSCPDRIHGDLQFYGLDPAISLKRVIDTYCRVAAGTKPDDDLNERIPTDIGQRIGFHIRLKDKLVEDEMAFDMSLGTWRVIEQQTLQYIEECVRRREPLFVCADDLPYRTALMQRIRACGGDVVAAYPPQTACNLSGHEALVDFFALSRCKRIVQMTKYSTFSIAAAIMADVPLINFYRNETDTGHRMDIWKSCLRR